MPTQRTMTIATVLVLSLTLASTTAPLQAQVGLSSQSLIDSSGKETFVISAVPLSTKAHLSLLRRSDVQNHLRLTLRQKKELGLTSPSGDKRTAGSRGAEQDRAPGLPAPIRVEVSESASSEERQRQVEDATEKMRVQVKESQGATDEKIKEVLTPEQLKRLAELDLQFRGPLALGDPKVAEEVKLAPEKRGPIATLAREVQRKKAEATAEALKEGRNIPQEMKNRLSPLRKKTDKAREEAEAKILAMLSPEETARWEAAQGKPFLFRTDL